MIRNIAQNKWQISREITSLVGKPFSFEERYTIRGIGSPKYEILESSKSISFLLAEVYFYKYCTLELRPSGLVVWLGYDNNQYAWAIPYFKLNAFALGNDLTLQADNEYMLLKNHYSLKHNNEFVKKLRELRAQYTARAMAEN